MRPSYEHDIGKIIYNDVEIPLEIGTDEKFAQLVQDKLTKLTKDDWGGIRQIRPNCFANLVNLEEVYIPAGIILNASAFQSNRGLKTVIIEEGHSSIPSRCFYMCQAVEYVDLPSTITQISLGGLNFSTSSSQPFTGTIKIRATVPPTLQYGASSSSNSSLQYYGDYTIEVPKGCLDAYKTATNWATYDVDNGGPATFVEYEE